MNDLAKAFVLDYDDWGLAVKASETSLRSLDGESLVDLQPALSPAGEAEGLEVYINGIFAEAISYSDEQFNEKLVKTLSGPLNF
jgi:hypothetical protein